MFRTAAAFSTDIFYYFIGWFISLHGNYIVIYLVSYIINVSNIDKSTRFIILFHMICITCVADAHYSAILH